MLKSKASEPPTAEEPAANEPTVKATVPDPIEWSQVVTVSPREQLRIWSERFGHIGEDINWLFRNQLVWNDIVGTLARQEHWRETGFFVNWLADQFWRSQAIGARRHVDRHKDANSLSNHLDAVLSSPEIISRANYVEFRLQNPVEDLRFRTEILNLTYDSYCSSPGEDLLALDRLTADLQVIDDACGGLGKIADRRVAHHDSRPVDNATFADIRLAVETLERVWSGLHPLFVGSAWGGWETQQMWPWRTPFRDKYFREDRSAHTIRTILE